MDPAVIAASGKQRMGVIMMQVKNAYISTPEEYEALAQLIKDVKDRDKAITDSEKAITDPIKGSLERIKALFKPVHDEAALIEQLGKQALLDYDQWVADQGEVMQEQVDAGEITETQAIATTAQLTVKSKAATKRKVWKLIEIDGRLTPTAYMVPSEPLILAAFKAGLTVPGWEYKQVPQIAI